jgi:hypothetical protein
VNRRTFVGLVSAGLAAGVAAWMPEDYYARVLRYENKNRNFAACRFCGAKTFEQHDSNCRHASILMDPSARIALLIRRDGSRTQAVCANQDEAIAWLRERWTEGDNIEICPRFGPLKCQKIGRKS